MRSPPSQRQLNNNAGGDDSWSVGKPMGAASAEAAPLLARRTALSAPGTFFYILYCAALSRRSVEGSGALRSYLHLPGAGPPLPGPHACLPGTCA